MTSRSPSSAARDPHVALDDHGIRDPDERRIRGGLPSSKLRRLHRDGRDHIWAYYTRNLVRPVALSHSKARVDVIVGNPPWINYNQTVSILRDELVRQSRTVYSIWAGGQVRNPPGRGQPLLRAER